MEKPAVNGSPRHWSTHPAKLAVVTAVITAVLSAAQLAVLLALLNEGLTAGMIPDATMALLNLPTLLVLAGWIALATVVLRAQARRELAGRVKNRISWAALPGLVVLLALLSMDLWGLRYPDSRVEHVLNIASTMLGLLLMAVQPVLIAALLIPALRPRTGLTIGALIVAAVTLLPTLTQELLMVALGNEVQLGLWVVFQLPQLLTFAVAVALLQLVRLRLWDALALQWGLYMALSVLRGLWNTDASASAAAWLNGAHQLILWALPALAALYCLLMWDRGISPARPFVAFARRVRALAQHFLPT